MLLRSSQSAIIQFCIFVFAAGKYTVFEAVKLLDGLSWGIAGRNKEKLESTLKEIGKKADKDLSRTPIIIADVNDEDSLNRMSERAKVCIYLLWCLPFSMTLICHWALRSIRFKK